MKCKCGEIKNLLKAEYKIYDEKESILIFKGFICKKCYLTKNKFSANLDIGIEWYRNEDLKKYDWDYEKIKESKKKK